MKITVETIVKAPVAKVWHGYTTPEAITQWNAASDYWHTTKATVDLRVGGEFSSRMEAKDGSFGFDFAVTYTKVMLNESVTRLQVRRRHSLYSPSHTQDTGHHARCT